MHYAKVYDEDRAAFWDIVICLLSSVLSLTLWSASGQNALVLVAFAFGNGLGTKYVVRYNAKKAWKDALYEHIRSQSEET